MFKRVMALLLSLVLVSASISGCTRAQESKKDTGKESDVKEINMLIFGLQVNDASKYKYHNEVQDAINEKLQKDLGFKVKVITTSYVDQFETMLALDFAAQKSYDIIRATSGIASSYAQKGMLKDITSLINESAPNIKAYVPESAFAESSFNGKKYGIPVCSFPVVYGMWIRQDWLKKASLQVPTNLAELENVLKSFCDGDFDGNNKKDTIPMAGSLDFMEMVFLGMFTDTPGEYVNNEGKITSKYLNPQYKEFTRTLARWYKEGYINDLLINGNENMINDLISKDKVGVHVGNAFQLEYTPLKSYNENKNLEMTWMMPFASDTKKYYSAGVGSDVMIFPATGKNTEYALKYYDWYFNNEENSDLVLYGIKDKTYVTTTDSATNKQMIDIPDAEKVNNINTPADLIGYFGTNVSGRLQLRYTSSTRPAEAAKAYDQCNSADVLKNIHTDISKYFQIDLPPSLSPKYTDARDTAKKWISEMIIGTRGTSDADFEALTDKFKSLGGFDAYDELTKKYNEIKDTLKLD